LSALGAAGRGDRRSAFLKEPLQRSGIHLRGAAHLRRVLHLWGVGSIAAVASLRMPGFFMEAQAMSLLDRFQVVLMPQRVVLATGLTMAEAAAYVRGYEEVSDPGECQAVIARGSQIALAASARRLRRPAQAAKALRSA
jgi:hypothetical protein